MPSDTPENQKRRSRFLPKLDVWSVLPFDLPKNWGRYFLMLVALVVFAVWFASRGGTEVSLLIVDVNQEETFDRVRVWIDRVFYSTFRDSTEVSVTGLVCNRTPQAIKMYDVDDPENLNQFYWGDAEGERANRVLVGGSVYSTDGGGDYFLILSNSSHPFILTGEDKRIPSEGAMGAFDFNGLVSLEDEERWPIHFQVPLDNYTTDVLSIGDARQAYPVLANNPLVYLSVPGIRSSC